MNVNGQNWFPYLPAAWLQRLVELIRRSVPARIDVDWCVEGDRFSFTRANASQLVSQVKALGWVAEDGSVTERGRNLRLQGEAYRKFIEEETARIYDDLVEQLNEEAFDREDLETYFTSASSLGLSGRRQIIGTLRWFLSQGGQNGLAERIGGGSPAGSVARPATSAKRVAPKPSRRDRAALVPPGGNGAAAPPNRLSLPQGLSGITLSISLQLPAVEDERVYQAIFKAMREHLFGQATGSDS